MGMWKEAGIKVIPVVASVAQARLMEKSGADAVVAEGMESGGHIGEATTMTLSQMDAALRRHLCWAQRRSRWEPASSYRRNLS